MYRNHRIAVVIPAHNEAKHLGKVVAGLPTFVDHVIVIDDASADETSQSALATGDSRLTLIRHEKNFGVGGAVTSGYARALELESDVIVKMDGDGQMNPAYLEELLNPLIEAKYDYAKGNRFLAGDSLGSMPKIRLLGNIVLTFLTKLSSGYWHVFDPQNGYTAIRAKTLKLLDIKTLHCGYFFENDMLVRLNIFNARVKDVGIPAYYGEEISDLNPFKIGLSFPFLLVRRFLSRIYQKYILRDFSPIALFLIFGTLLFVWGAGFGLYLWIHTLGSGIATPTGTIMLSLLPTILGFQLLLQFLVMDIQETPR